MKIRDQVYLISFISSIVPLIILAILTFFTLEYELRETEEEKLEIIFSKGDMYLNNMFEHFESQLEILSEVIYTAHDPNTIREYVDIFSEKNEGVEYFAFGSTDGNFYTEKGSPRILNGDYDPRSRPWYRGALKTNNYYLSEVFTHAATGAPAVTISKKVIKGGKLQGVVVALINIKNLERAFEKKKDGKITEFLVVNGQGDVVIKTGNSDIIFERFREKLMSLQEEELTNITIDGEERIYHSHRVNGINLTIIGGILKEKLMAPVIKLQKNILVIVIFTVLLSTFLTLVFGRRFADSLTRLSHIIDNIARGNYNKNIVKLTDFIDVNSELHLVKEGIKKMQEEIRAREAKLKMISETDPLTEIYNRGAVMSLIEMELHRSNSFGTEFSLIMFDLDHFKSLNDTYGHQFGDKVLQVISKTSLEALKKEDIFGRYGGEEFLILLPDTDLEGGKVIAERVRSNMMNLKWDREVQVTASFGVTHCSGCGEDLEGIISIVDNLLYEAKKNGRNCVEFK